MFFFVFGISNANIWKWDFLAANANLFLGVSWA